MKIVTHKRDIKNALQESPTCIMVDDIVITDDPAIIGGFKAVYWFAIYEKRGNKIGWTKQAKATQIEV